MPRINSTACPPGLAHWLLAASMYFLPLCNNSCASHLSKDELSVIGLVSPQALGTIAFGSSTVNPCSISGGAGLVRDSVHPRCLPPLPALHGDAQFHLRKGAPRRGFALSPEPPYFPLPICHLRGPVDFPKDCPEMVLGVVLPAVLLFEVLSHWDGLVERRKARYAPQS